LAQTRGGGKGGGGEKGGGGGPPPPPTKTKTQIQQHLFFPYFLRLLREAYLFPRPALAGCCAAPLWRRMSYRGRVCLFVGMMYLVQYAVFLQFQNTIMLPGMMIMGALAMPFATAILFFELNAPRNVPFHRVLMLVGAGGVLSIFVSLIGFQISSLHQFLGAPAAGIVEEIGKLIAVVIMMRKADKLYLLNGVLFGAAVGAVGCPGGADGVSFGRRRGEGRLAVRRRDAEIGARQGPGSGHDLAVRGRHVVGSVLIEPPARLGSVLGLHHHGVAEHGVHRSRTGARSGAEQEYRCRDRQCLHLILPDD